MTSIHSAKKWFIMLVAVSCQNIGLPAKQHLFFTQVQSLASLPTMTKTAKEAATLQAYKSAIHALDSTHFKSDVCAFFAHSFQGKEKEMTGDAC